MFVFFFAKLVKTVSSGDVNNKEQKKDDSEVVDVDKEEEEEEEVEEEEEEEVDLNALRNKLKNLG